MRFLMPTHTLKISEIEKYYENKARFNGVYSRNYLPKKIKDEAYIINLYEYADEDEGTHWIALSCNRRRNPEEIKEFIGNKNIIVNIFRVQANNSVLCEYFCIGFIDFMLVGKKSTDFTNLFSPYDLEKNDNIILSYFKDESN